MVFVDEFLINKNTVRTYGWTRKGMPGRVRQKPIDFKMSFVVAHSHEKIEGIMGTSGIFNQIKYTYFLERLMHDIKQRQNVDQRKIIVVADNWRFHRTNKVLSFFKKEKIKWLFIPPYNPEINPCEKSINMIKEYVKSQASQQRYEKFYHRFRIIYLKTIEKAIDSVERKHWIGFVRKSIEETLHLLRRRIEAN